MTATQGYRSEAHAAAAKDLRRWAKTTDFTDPLDWRQVEAKIMSEPVPPHEDLEWYFSARSRSRLVPYLLVLPQVLLTSGLSLVGLGLAVAFSRNDSSLPELAETIAYFVFMGSIIVTFTPLLMWFSTRRRGGFGLLVTGGTALLSCLSLAVLATGQPIGIWSSIRTFAVIAAVTGAANFAFLLLVAKPGPTLTLREHLASPSLEDQWLQSQRALVLEQLKKRDLVSGWDIPNLMEMPRAAWRDLESLPDGRTVRRRR